MEKVDACGHCGGDSYVMETRVVPDGRLRRRRACKECGRRWTTYEGGAIEDARSPPKEFKCHRCGQVPSSRPGACAVGYWTAILRQDLEAPALRSVAKDVSDAQRELVIADRACILRQTGLGDDDARTHAQRELSGDSAQMSALSAFIDWCEVTADVHEVDEDSDEATCIHCGMVA